MELRLMSPQVLTGVFTLAGVALTAIVALIAAWLKYRLDKTIVSRNALREVLARAIAVGNEFEDLITAAKKAGEKSDGLNKIQTEFDSLYRQLRIVFTEVVLLTPSGYWEPYYKELATAYLEKKYLKPEYTDTFTKTIQPLYEKFVLEARRELG
jgi:hypothetical protein